MKKLFILAASLLTIAAKAPQDFGPSPVYTLAISDAERAVKVILNDPESAQFRYRDEALKLGKKGWIVCGQVNAKNAYGGYPGWASFVTTVQPGEEMKVKLAPVGLGYNECYRPSLAPADKPAA